MCTTQCVRLHPKLLHVGVNSFEMSFLIFSCHCRTPSPSPQLQYSWPGTFDGLKSLTSLYVVCFSDHSNSQCLCACSWISCCFVQLTQQQQHLCTAHWHLQEPDIVGCSVSSMFVPCQIKMFGINSLFSFITRCIHAYIHTHCVILYHWRVPNLLFFSSRDLTYNKLTIISDDAFLTLPLGVWIYLEGNPLSCCPSKLFAASRSMYKSDYTSRCVELPVCFSQVIALVHYNSHCAYTTKLD